MVVMDFPFDEHNDGGTCVRTFSGDVDEMELVWHRDAEDREVVSNRETDWMIQLDNELPKTLTESVYIPAGVYHRVIKGTGDLEVTVTKHVEKSIDPSAVGT